MTSRPSILWIFCEDLSPWFSTYGDATVPTPHIDRLAAEGAVFRRCFSPSPVCSPARSAIITGCWATLLGIHQHVSSRPGMPPIHLPDPVRTLPELMRDAGYFTYNLGKDDYNFDYRREDLYHGPHAHIRFYGEHHLGTNDLKGPDADFGYWRRREPSQPFFGQVTLWAGKNEVRVAPPVDPGDVRVMPYYPDTPAFRKQIARHYDQIRTTDAEVGRIVDQLRKEGLLDRTWIVFFSDHGYELLRHKQFCYDGGTHVPLIIRPPDGEAGHLRGTVRECLVSSLDVTATTLAIAGLDVPRWMHSRDLLSAGDARDHVVSTRDRCDGTIDRIRSVRTHRYRYIRNFHPSRPLLQPQYRSRTPCFVEFAELALDGRLPPAAESLAADERSAEELYDCAADPHEVRNVAGDPAFAAPLREHRRLLDHWMHVTADRGGEPEPNEQYRWLLNQWGPHMCWGPEYAAARAERSQTVGSES